MKRIKQNKLAIPNYNKHNLIDLLRVLYNYCGTNYKVNNNMKEIRKDVKNNKNIIFILVDGLGYNLVNTLPNDLSWVALGIPNSDEEVSDEE